jgi:hypothetical protein
MLTARDGPTVNITEAPEFCEYAAGPCDQSFKETRTSDGLFLYPNEPKVIADPIEEAIQQLRRLSGERSWISWKDLGISGQIIFCQICKALRFTKLVVADVTTLNFNLLFEIGYALGLGLPTIPIRDASFIKDQRAFDELGLLDTLGYVDFENSAILTEKLLSLSTSLALLQQRPSTNKEQPLYLMKSHVQTEGMVKLMSALKKSGLRFRSFDPRETPRLSLHDGMKQVLSSLGVLVHLVSPLRSDSAVHNGRCAFVAGMAMAAGKNVLMLQETETRQPIDFRDVVRAYGSAAKVPDLIIPLIRRVFETLQESRFVPITLPLRPLEKVDLGDLAAENEIRGLGSYFVPTAQYNEAKRGRARLVVGRKGSGKTAIFYAVRKSYWQSRSHLVLDLKPEGHQFTKLREAVLAELSPGTQQHVLTAFWNYLLLMELAHKIVREELNYSYRTPELRSSYLKVAETYGSDSETEQGDFSERLLRLVEDIATRRLSMRSIAGTSEVTQLVYSQDIRPLNEALGEYLKASKKEDAWLLFDNLDKGWPIAPARFEDLLILRSLLEATRKLQRQFEARGVEFHAVVFVRNDIYQHLLFDPGDRGKETAVLLDWNDPELFREMIRRRLILSTELDGTFEDLWRIFFVPHIGGEESFSYILDRTLMRPREVLQLVRDCIDVAVNRSHEKVAEGDILQAELSYSHHQLADLVFDLRDVRPQFADAPYAFIESRSVLSRAEVEKRIAEAGIDQESVEQVLELLLWFGFLGIQSFPEGERYSYQYEHDLRKMQSGLDRYSYSIHPAFQKALGCT